MAANDRDRVTAIHFIACDGKVSRQFWGIDPRAAQMFVNRNNAAAYRRIGEDRKPYEVLTFAVPVDATSPPVQVPKKGRSRERRNPPVPTSQRCSTSRRHRIHASYDPPRSY